MKEGPYIIPVIIPLILGLGVPGEGVQQSCVALLGVLDTLFDRLGEDDISKIIELQLSLIDKRLDKQGLKIEISPEVIEFISAEGYDPIYGARPLKRAIQRHLLDPLSMSLLNGEFESGDTINVSLYSGNLKFDKSSQNGGIKNSK